MAPADAQACALHLPSLWAEPPSLPGASLSRIDPKNRDPPTTQTAGAVRPPKNASDLPKFVADNALVTVTTTAYEKVKEVRAVLTEEDKGRKFTIRFSHRGKARLRVTDEAGNVHLEKEYSSAEEAVRTEEVKLKKKSGSVLVAVLELASPDGVTPAENRIFEVSYGQAEFEYGVVQALPVSFSTAVHSVRLFYTGTGVVFQVSTDGGIKWHKLEPGREVMLDEPGTNLLVKVLLLIDPATVLYDYLIEINPYHDMSFTGKFLEPEIGLIYFGGRWYEPGIGRWITPDPGEDGENWFGYCYDNPIRAIDRDGYFANWTQPFKLVYGIAEESVKMAAIAVVIGAITPYISPILPILTPVFIYMGLNCIINDTTYLIKNFDRVFLGKPTDNECIEYGRRLSRTFSIMVFGVKSVKRLKGYSSSQQFQQKSGWGPGTKKTPWHHLVQQHPQNVAKFGNKVIHNIMNMIKLPSSVHFRITTFQNRPHPFTNSMPFWKWLSNKSYPEQWFWGLKILIKAYLNIL